MVATEMRNKMIKTYSELIKFTTFEERFKYLSLAGRVGEETYGFDRWINQNFYRSSEWKQIRNHVIVRDSGCDLGILGREVYDNIIVHHMNPIRASDIEDGADILLNPEFLICTSHITHQAIHYGDENLLISEPVVRTPNDTCPWKH